MTDLTSVELIDLKWIARSFNERLGTGYRVVPNSKTEIQKDNKIEIILQALRIPFAVDGINSETLQITLDIYAPVGKETRRDEVFSDLNVLIGHKDGEIDTGKRVYSYASFLEFQKPLGPPQLDTGTFMQLLNITGTMLVSDKETGATISNHVFTKLTVNDIGGFIPTLQVDTTLNFASEPAPIGDDNTLMIMHNARGVNIEISALMLTRALDTEIIRLVNQIGDGIELNEIITVERYYPTETPTNPPAPTFSKRCKVLTAAITEQAGAYVSYRIGLQEVKDSG